MQRIEQRSSTWQIAFRLCDGRLHCKGIHIVRCDIENLIKLSQCLGETAKMEIGKGMLVE